jgi:hypothetical protein
MHPILAGSLAGGIGYLGTLPLDYIKQHLQSSTNMKESTRLIQHSIRDNGWRVLFKGGVIGCASIVPQMAIKFSVNDLLTRKTQNTAFTNGFIAGYIDGSFLGPVLAVQSVMQMESNTKGYGYQQAFRAMRHVPLLPFTFPLAMRNAAYTSVLFGGQDYCVKNGWGRKDCSADRQDHQDHQDHQGRQDHQDRQGRKGRKDHTFMRNFLITSVLNIPGVIACSPFDVIRAKQIQSLTKQGSSDASNNPLSIARDIYHKGGVRGFYQGFGSLYVNFAIRFPFTFSVYHLLTHL